MTLMTLIDILNDIDDLPLNNLQVLKPMTFSMILKRGMAEWRYGKMLL